MNWELDAWVDYKFNRGWGEIDVRMGDKPIH